MTRVPSLAVALGAALALGACAGEGGQLATSPEAPAFQTGGVGPACSLTDLRKATSALFGSRHAANDIAKQFTSKNQNTAAATPFAYNLFQQIELKRQNGPWASTDPAKGAELTLQIIACSDLDYTDDGLEGTEDLANARAAFQLALDVEGVGTYAVRGGGATGGELAVAAKNGHAGVAPIGSTFGAWLPGGRWLIIGYDIPAFLGEDIVNEIAYDWSFVRPNGAGNPAGLAVVSFCVPDNFGSTVAEYRVQHRPTADDGVILPINLTGSGINCIPGVANRSAAPVSLATRLLQTMFEAVRPAPLFAAVAYGPVSGTLGDFSPTAVVDPGTVNLTFSTQPGNANAGQPLPTFAVRVAGENGTPWEGVTVRLEAFANNGQNLQVCNRDAITNSDGVATFSNTYLTKPGGAYFTATTIEATGAGGDIDVGGGYFDSVESQRFNVGPGSATC